MWSNLHLKFNGILLSDLFRVIQAEALGQKKLKSRCSPLTESHVSRESHSPRNMVKSNTGTASSKVNNNMPLILYNVTVSRKL